MRRDRERRTFLASSSSPPKEKRNDTSDDEEEGVVEKQHSKGDLNSRHPWFEKWVENGSNIEELTPERYSPGSDPKRNESESREKLLTGRRLHFTSVVD